MLNNTVHIDLTGPELQRIIAVTEYIAKYEIMMELALPQIRALGTARQWKRMYTNLVRKLAEVTTPPSERPPEKRRVMDWSEDPVLRLEKLRRLIKSRYDELYSTCRVEDIIKAHLYDDDGEEDGA